VPAAGRRGRAADLARWSMRGGWVHVWRLRWVTFDGSAADTAADAAELICGQPPRW